MTHPFTVFLCFHAFVELSMATLLHRALRGPSRHIEAKPIASCAHFNSASMSATHVAGMRISTNNSMLHIPSKPSTLREYKEEAQECLTFCASLGNTCFRSCLDDCSKYLGPPPCIAFALQADCYETCGQLYSVYSCLSSVSASNTHECHLQFNEVTMPSAECRLPK